MKIKYYRAVILTIFVIFSQDKALGQSEEKKSEDSYFFDDDLPNKTKAQIIWATTTYIPEGSAGRISGDEMLYNQVSLEVLKDFPEIQICDLYTASLDFKPLQLDANVHYLEEGYVRLGKVAATYLLNSCLESNQLIWNVEAQFGVTKDNAKPGTDLALDSVAEYLKENPGDQVTLKYNSGTYFFLGTDPSIDLPIDFDPGINGRLFFEGEGMRNTTFITANGSAPDINGQNVHRITFRGIAFARNYLTVTQGTIVSVNNETEEVILALHPGFPTPEEIWSVPGKPLSQGKYLRKYTDDQSDPKVILENNRQVHYDPDNTSQAENKKWVFKIDRNWNVARDEYKTGDIIGVKCKHGGNTYQFEGGSDIVFEDCLWTHRSRGVFKGGCTNIRFSRCRIERLSDIDGRIPCLATPGGGPQIGQPDAPRIGDVVIEDCHFNSCGDDNIALFNVDGAIIRNTYSYNSFAANIKLFRCTDVVIENTMSENGYFIIREDYEGDEYFLYGLQNTIVNPLR